MTNVGNDYSGTAVKFKGVTIKVLKECASARVETNRGDSTEIESPFNLRNRVTGRVKFKIHFEPSQRGVPAKSRTPGISAMPRRPSNELLETHRVPRGPGQTLPSTVEKGVGGA